MRPNGNKYQFRIRAALASTTQLMVPQEEMLLWAEGPEHCVKLLPYQGATLSEARGVIVRGGDFETEEKARARGAEWLWRLRCLFIYLRQGADLGVGKPTGSASEEGLALLAKQYGVPRVLWDNHGLSTFESEPTPRFARFDAEARKASDATAVHSAIAFAVEARPLTERVTVAYDLTAASMSMSGETRFLTLMMALESLLDRQRRSDEARQLLAGFVDYVRGSSLTPVERDSLANALHSLKWESIRHAGRLYASRLDPKTYAGRAAPVFFQDCYTIRSKLMHGSPPRPSRSDVDPLAAVLEVFVNDLLRTELGLPPE